MNQCKYVFKKTEGRYCQTMTMNEECLCGLHNAKHMEALRKSWTVRDAKIKERRRILREATREIHV